MAYNPYFMQSYPQQIQMINQPQNGGLVSVRNEEEARNYPVGNGLSVTFKDENAPYVYTKTMGFSQFDHPRFEKYRLVKEEPSEASYTPQKDALDENTINSTMNDLKSEIEAIWSEIEGIKAKDNVPKRNSTAKREKDGDD